MRTARWKAPAEAAYGYYHCISRVVDRRLVFGELEKEMFGRLMRCQAAFSGIRILTYCLMGNHFHLLVEVPRRPEVLPGEEELFRRLGHIQSKGTVTELRRRLGELPEAERSAMLVPYWRRMWDLSSFMKELKQRFTQWHNKRQGRVGTLWEERFKSVLVGGDGHALATMAAYIDLNPVRAGLASDPKDYRWSGYAEAVAGRKEAREAYRTVLGMAEGQERADYFEAYRVWLYASGAPKGVNTPGEAPAVRRSVPPERVKEVLENRGRLGREEYLMCRMRHFTDGAVLGSREFVEGMFGKWRERFGTKRRDGARELRHIDGEPLFAIRDLRRSPIG